MTRIRGLWGRKANRERTERAKRVGERFAVRSSHDDRPLRLHKYFLAYSPPSICLCALLQIMFGK